MTPDEIDREVLRVLTAPLDEVAGAWGEFQRGGARLDGVSAHQLGPALRVRLDRAGVFPVGPELTRLYLQNLRAVRAFIEATVRIGECFRVEGIDAVALKGLALVGGGHCDPGGRVMGDVDLLVPPARFVDAVALLAEAGWRSERPRRVFDERFEHARPLRDPSGTLVDLHARLLKHSHAPGEDDALRARAVSSTILGAVRVPHPSDQLLHAVMHGTQAGRAPHRRWIVDVAQLIETGRVDWSVLTEAAARRGVGPLVGEGLGWLAAEFGFLVPGEAATGLARTPEDPCARAFHRARRLSRSPRLRFALANHWAELGVGVGASPLARLRALPAYARSVAGEPRLVDCLPRILTMLGR